MPITAVQLGLGVAKTAEGLINARKTKKEANILEKTRPKLGRDAIADENLALAKSDLAQGMSAKSEQAYKDLNDSEFSSSLGAILRSGGAASNIADVYGKGQTGALKLATMQDELRLQQINNLIRTSQPVEQRDLEMFQYNTDAPWKDKAQANSAARTGAQDQIWAGLNTAGSAFIQAGQENKEADLFEKYFGNKGGTSTTGADLTGGRFSTPQSTIPTERQPLDTEINPNSRFDNEQPIFNNNSYDFWGQLYNRR